MTEQFNGTNELLPIPEPKDSVQIIGEVALRPTLPRNQSRQEWKHELMAVVTEARSRGDDRPSMAIYNEWLNFRNDYVAPEN